MKTIKWIMSVGLVASLSASALGQVTTLTFQDGLNGYAGTRDVSVRGAAPDLNIGTDIEMSVDLSDGGFPTQGLLQFRDLIGAGSNQILAGSTIQKAEIQVWITSVGDILNVHRMLQSWDESTATWNSLGNGIQANGVEAATASTFTSTFVTPAGAWFNFDVTADVQAFANGATNNGWAFLPTAGNGVDWYTRDYTLDPSLRNKLVVTYDPIPEPMTMGVLAIAGLLAARRRRA